LLLAALLVGWLPSAYSSFVIVATGSFTTSALLFAAVLLVCGVVVLTVPSLSTLFGFLGMVISTLALLGALGGFLIGTVIGCLGGLLSFAWSPPSAVTETGPAETGDDGSTAGDR
jgi:hypothetical protein